MPHMRMVDAAEVTRLLPMAGLVEALRAMFQQGCEVPLRHTHQVGAGTLLIMPAWQEGRYLGVKTVSICPGNAEMGLPGLHSTYLLSDARTGVPLMMADGNVITSRRTVAASALAASRLARGDASRLLVVGAGRVARLLPEAYRAVRPITTLRVWSRQAASARRLVEELRAQGWDAQATEDLRDAAAWADIVSCATLSTAPLIQGAWLRPGVHLDLIGGFTPAMRETDVACFARSRVFVDTDEALLKAGDLLAAIQAGVWQASLVQGRLGDLCRADGPCRRTADEITVFKSVGNALEDLAAAVSVWEQLDG